MLTIDLDDFAFELADGAVKHVGPSNRSATAKLYDVDAVEVREFGDKRLKLAFTDEDGSEIEIALFPEQARDVVRGVERLEADSPVFE